MKILNRAKSKYKDYYPIGQWLELGDKYFIIEDKVGFAIEDTMGWFDDEMMDGNIQLQDFIYEVEKDTRALNFEGMLDRQGNKIFASLSEDGKGGNILEWTIFQDDMQKLRINGVPYYSKGGAFKVTGRIEMMWHLLAPHKECKIIGIQE